MGRLPEVRSEAELKTDRKQNGRSATLRPFSGHVVSGSSRTRPRRTRRHCERPSSARPTFGDTVVLDVLTFLASPTHPRPPGPRGVPLLGMMPALRRNPTAVFAAAARSFGDVAYLKIGPRRGYLVTHPDDIRHVLQDNARNYHKSPLYDKLRVSLGQRSAHERGWVLVATAAHGAACLSSAAHRTAGVRHDRSRERDGGTVGHDRRTR